MLGIGSGTNGVELGCQLRKKSRVHVTGVVRDTRNRGTKNVPSRTAPCVRPSHASTPLTPRSIAATPVAWHCAGLSSAVCAPVPWYPPAWHSRTPAQDKQALAHRHTLATHVQNTHRMAFATTAADCVWNSLRASAFTRFKLVIRLRSCSRWSDDSNCAVPGCTQRQHGDEGVETHLSDHLHLVRFVVGSHSGA